MLNEVVKEQDFHGQGSQFQLHNALHHHLVVEKHEHDWLLTLEGEHSLLKLLPIDPMDQILLMISSLNQ